MPFHKLLQQLQSLVVSRNNR